MSLLKANAVQLGQSLTASQNFTWYQPATPDGTVRLGNGNSGSVTDLVTLTSAGNLGVGTSSPANKLHVVADGINSKFSASTSTASSTSQWLNGTGGMYVGVDNSTGSQFVGAAYSGNIWVSGAYPLCFSTNGAERMRLDSSGNLGLGVTPSAWGSGFKALQVGARGSVYAGSDASMRLAYNAYYDGTSYKRIAASSASQWIADTDGSFAWFQAGSSTAGSAISFTQAMTLDASGKLGIGTTSPVTSLQVVNTGTPITGGVNYGGSIIQNNGGSAYDAAQYCIAGATGNARFIGGYSTGASNITIVAEFYSDNTNTRACARAGGSGGVYLSSGATSWLSLSDERHKTDLKPIENAAQKVSALRAVTGRYKTDEEGVSRAFLIAQDVQAVLPEAIDATDPESLGVRYTDTIPLLVAAIKELSAELNELKQKVNA